MNAESSHITPNPKLFAALVKAQNEAKYVKKDRPSNFGDRPYAASEDIINDCKEPLNKHGLALLPLSFSSKPDSAISDPPEQDKKTTWLKRPLMTERWFKLGHESGEFEIIGPYDWPTNPNNMNTNFTAFGGTDTFSLAYVYRDILGMPRLTAQEIKQLELEEQKMLQAIGIARAENGLTTPPAEKKQEKPKAEAEKKPEAKKEVAAPADQKLAAITPDLATNMAAATKTEPAKPDTQKSSVIVLQPAGAPGDASAASPPTSAPAAGASNTSSTPASSTASPTPSGSTAPATAGAPPAQPAPKSPGEVEPAKASPPQGAASVPEQQPSGSSKPQTETPKSSEKSSASSASATPVASSGSSSGSTSGSSAPTAPDQAQILKDRQTAMFQRLFRYAEKRLQALSGDEGTFAAELNAATGTTLYEIKEGKKGAFKRPGLTDEAMKKLVPVLQMAGV